MAVLIFPHTKASPLNERKMSCNQRLLGNTDIHLSEILSGCLALGLRISVANIFLAFKVVFTTLFDQQFFKVLLYFYTPTEWPKAGKH